MYGGLCEAFLLDELDAVRARDVRRAGPEPVLTATLEPAELARTLRGMCPRRRRFRCERERRLAAQRHRTIVGSDTLGRLLGEWARATPDTPWLVFEREPGKIETTTWSEALRRARAAAAILRQAGLGRGDRFHVHLANTPEFYDFWFAVSMTGTVMLICSRRSVRDRLVATCA